MPGLPLTTTYDAAASVLAVSGDIDAESTEGLRQAIEECSHEYRIDLVVDLTGVTFLPSVAIGTLVRVEQSFQASGHSFELAAKAGSVADRLLTVSAMPFRSY